MGLIIKSDELGLGWPPKCNKTTGQTDSVLILPDSEEMRKSQMSNCK